MSNPDKRFSNVVLPEPERPIKARVSPGITSKETSLTAMTLADPEPNTRVSPRAEITGSFDRIAGVPSELKTSLNKSHEFAT